ncbi:Prostatic acid phosphatase [Trichinella zimbabwensis]|uniref:acid phosphatase n=1 Tax=Trichinella zimbabwensis TaxID=268475 RepID=A0A0V1HM60_9BILA|nr:Prostatic acid phosphatase [Trichinella zimbabwensis]
MSTMANLAKSLPLVLILIQFSHAEAETILLQVLKSHAQTTPTANYPTSKLPPGHILLGYGQLTMSACESAFNYGKQLKNAYPRLIDNQYRSSEISVRSLATDAALTSATCLLQGIFPAKNPTVWYPIPVYSVPLERDFLLNVDANCPNYKKVFNAESKTSIKAVNKRYNNFYAALRKLTGIKNMNMKKAVKFLNIYKQEEMLNFQHPWMNMKYENKTIQDTLKNLEKINFDFKFGSFKKAKLKSGYLLGKIMENIKQKSLHTHGVSQPSVYIYSVNKQTLISLMHAIRLADCYIVKEGSSIVFQMKMKQTWTVEMLVQNENFESMGMLQSKKCANFTYTFEKFVEIFKNATLYPLEERHHACSAMYRHGYRTPLGTFPTDEYKEWAYPNGFRQLTKLGCQQQYELGQYLRSRYANFLSDHYNASEVYVRSTDTDRTLSSAECNLAGMFPPDESQIWNENIRWQPVPVHTLPTNQEYLLRTGFNCPALHAVFQTQSNELIEKVENDYKELFAYLENKTGWQKIKWNAVGKIVGSLKRIVDAGYTLPDWCNKTWLDHSTNEQVPIIDLLSKLGFQRRLLEFNSVEKSKYEGGLLIGTIMKNMKQKIQGRLFRPTKMFIYSAHDGTLLSFLYGLEIANGLMTPVASAVMVELYETDQGDHNVQIYFRNNTKVDPVPLTLPGCKTFACPLEEFEKAIQPVAFYTEAERHRACFKNSN